MRSFAPGALWKGFPAFSALEAMVCYGPAEGVTLPPVCLPNSSVCGTIGAGMDENEPIEGYVTVEDASRLAGVTESYIRRLCRSGRLSCAHASDRWFVALRSLSVLIPYQPGPGRPRSGEGIPPSGITFRLWRIEEGAGEGPAKERDG